MKGNLQKDIANAQIHGKAFELDLKIGAIPTLLVNKSLNIAYAMTDQFTNC